MPEKLTEWYPADVPPIHTGYYNVKSVDLVNTGTAPLIDRAKYLTKFGTSGFWREVSTTDGRHTWSLLNVVAWQGRKLTPRVVILPEGSPAVIVPRRTLNPAQGAPRTRVALIPPTPGLCSAVEGKRCQICRVAPAAATRKDSRGRNQAVCDSCIQKKSPRHLSAGSRKVVA